MYDPIPYTSDNLRLRLENTRLRKAFVWAMENEPGTPVPDWVEEILNG